MPKFLKSIFWDVPFKNIDVRKHSSYIISRILEFGNLKAIKWMVKTYSKTEIIQVLKNGRGFSLKSANFWALIFNIELEEVLCLSKQYQKQHRKIWKY